MAYFQISRNAKGELVAKVQVSCKNPDNGKSKLYARDITIRKISANQNSESMSSCLR